MTVRAVFFDMGGTIETFGWTPELRIRETIGIRQCLSDSGIHLGLTDQRLYEIISAGLDAYHQASLLTIDELTFSRRVWNEYIFSSYPVDPEKLASIAEDLMLFIETHYYQRSMRPEVPAVLKAIQKMGLKIGLISNVNSQSQVPANLDLYGIRHYFDPIVLSSVYGRRKPDPSIFHYAARQANVPTSECLYIGDRIARDIVGARKAGFKLAVQILHDFDHGEEDTGSKPDAVITNMTALLDILKDELDHPKCTVLPSIQQHNNLRALLFDAGDILYFRPNRDRNLLEFLTGLGIADKVIPYEKKQEYRDQSFNGIISQDQYRLAYLGLYGITESDLLKRGCQAMEQDDNDVQIFDGVPETLQTLKDKGYLLGIITDTANPIYAKLSWFERGGFGHVWDSIISSQELGFKKPDPRIYQAALQQLGLSVQQVAFIGHSPDELDGAHAIGMKTIAFNYGKRANADYFIEKFQHLLTVPLLFANDEEESGIQK